MIMASIFRKLIIEMEKKLRVMNKRFEVLSKPHQHYQSMTVYKEIYRKKYF